MESHKNVAFIEELFYKQIRNLTHKNIDSFEVQHSDVWL